MRRFGCLGLLVALAGRAQQPVTAPVAAAAAAVPAAPASLPARSEPPPPDALPGNPDAPLPAPHFLDPGLLRALPPGDATVPPGFDAPLPPEISYRLFPWTDGNAVRLLTDGREAFPEILAALAGAQRTILIESYIFGDDELGDRVLAILTERARAGVRVRLLIDGLGSEHYPEAKFAPLRAAGGGALIFRKMNVARKLAMPFSSLRNHRKFVVVDGTVAFLGGINLAANETDWHDFAVRVEGPAVAQVTRLFTALWQQRAKERLEGEAYAAPPGDGATPPGGAAVRVVGNQARAVRWEFYAAYRDAIRAAQREVLIANAYFVPDRRIRAELYAAVRRGVRVVLLLPGESDVPMVQAASEHLYRRMLKNGLEIRVFTGTVLHAKAAVIDGRWVTVGSYNLERHSLHNNLEANLVIDDPVLGMALREVLVADFHRSHPVTLAEWERRPWLAKLRTRWYYSFRKFM